MNPARSLMRILLIVLTFLATSIHAGQALDSSCCRLAASTPAGRAMELQVTVTNLQDQPVIVHDSVAEWDLRVQIKGANGQQVSLNDYGQRVLTQLRGGSMRKGELARGDQFTKSLDLGKLFQLASGSYTVTVARDVFVVETVEGKVADRKIELQTTTTIRIP
jgi:hypothetical protein